MRTLKVLDSQCNYGVLRKDGRYVAKVVYSLHVMQEVTLEQTPDGVQEVQGPTHTSGKLLVIKGNRKLSLNRPLKLHLIDNRRINIIARRGWAAHGEYEIEAQTTPDTSLP